MSYKVEITSHKDDSKIGAGFSLEIEDYIVDMFLADEIIAIENIATKIMHALKINFSDLRDEE